MALAEHITLDFFISEKDHGAGRQDAFRDMGKRRRPREHITYLIHDDMNSLRSSSSAVWAAHRTNIAVLLSTRLVSE